MIPAEFRGKGESMKRFFARALMEGLTAIHLIPATLLVLTLYLIVVDFLFHALLSFSFGIEWQLTLYATAWQWKFYWQWNGYIVLATLMLIMWTAFVYENCCIGIHTFWAHLKHEERKDYLESLMYAVFWPYFCLYLNVSLMGWGLNWGNVSYSPVELVLTWLKGVRIQILTFGKDGEPRESGFRLKEAETKSREKQ